MPFFECEFPREIAFHAIGGPVFSTQVNEGFSGFEQRNRNWSQARGKWKISLAYKPISYFESVYNFWLAVGGKADGFRLFDPKDNQAINAPCVQLADSPFTGCLYQLQNSYAAGPRTYLRTVVKPITTAVIRFDGTYCTGTPKIFVDGRLQTSGWTLDPTTGVLRFSVSPGTGVVTWTGQFHFPVRFDTDECQAVIEPSNVLAGEAIITWSEVSLIELRLISPAAVPPAG